MLEGLPKYLAICNGHADESAKAAGAYHLSSGPEYTNCWDDINTMIADHKAAALYAARVACTWPATVKHIKQASAWSAKGKLALAHAWTHSAGKWRCSQCVRFAYTAKGKQRADQAGCYGIPASMLAVALRGPSLNHLVFLGWADGGPILYCARCCCTARRMPKGLEQPCKGPERVKWRMEARRLRQNLAPDTGSPLAFVQPLNKESTMEGLKLLVMNLLTEAVATVPKAKTLPAPTRYEVGPGARLRLSVKTGPYGQAGAPRRRCPFKRPAFSSWHAYPYLGQRQGIGALSPLQGCSEVTTTIPSARDRIAAIRYRVLKRQGMVSEVDNAHNMSVIGVIGSAPPPSLLQSSPMSDGGESSD